MTLYCSGNCRFPNCDCRLGRRLAQKENSRRGFCGGGIGCECKNRDSRRCSERVAITPKRKSEAERSGGERKPNYLTMMSET